MNALPAAQMEWHPLADGLAPVWCSEWGEDTIGAWVGVTVKDVTQRFRWIRPGRFLMGSPEDEAERYGGEGPQHEVAITQGLWLAETACTQALWEAVMVDNPGRFKGPQRPVEQVSWDDVQGFLSRINALLPDLELRLPTEAQWEYACRAGSTTPFSFGDDINSDQVNFNGNYPYRGRRRRRRGSSRGKAGTYREETVDVRTLPPNAWGLHEMHGNVWEWCADGQREYHEGVQRDPVGEQGAGVARAVRGGSWISNARGVRSARRVWFGPGYRAGILGFRLARVQE